MTKIINKNCFFCNLWSLITSGLNAQWITAVRIDRIDNTWPARVCYRAVSLVGEVIEIKSNTDQSVTCHHFVPTHAEKPIKGSLNITLACRQQSKQTQHYCPSPTKMPQSDKQTSQLVRLIWCPVIGTVFLAFGQLADCANRLHLAICPLLDNKVHKIAKFFFWFTSWCVQWQSMTAVNSIWFSACVVNVTMTA